MLIKLLYEIANQVNRLIGIYKYKNMERVNFFYQNSFIYKVSKCGFWISFFMIIISAYLNIHHREFLNCNEIYKQNDNIFNFLNQNIETYTTICLSIFTAIFVNASFYYFTTFQEICQKDKNSIEILKIIARCYYMNNFVVEKIKSNSLCYNKCGFIPNQYIEQLTCPFGDTINSSPDTFCYCSKNIKNTHICNSNYFFSRIIMILIYNMDKAYSIASLNKVMMMGYIDYIKNNLLKFEIMLRQNDKLDISYLSCFDEVNAYLSTGKLDECLRNENIELIIDIKQINKIYNSFEKESMIYCLKNLQPLDLGIILNIITR